MDIQEFCKQYDTEYAFASGDWVRVRCPSTNRLLADLRYDPATAEAVLTALGVKKIDPFQRLLKKHGFDLISRSRPRPYGTYHDTNIQLEVWQGGSISILTKSSASSTPTGCIACHITIEHADRILTAIYGTDGAK